MSRIVLGVGTSHSPLLAIDPALWAERGKDDMRREKVWLADGRMISYAQLHGEVGDRYIDDATPDRFAEQSRLAQAQLDRLSGEILGARPDLVVVIGDDQEELFGLTHTPAFAVYVGDEIVTHPKGEVSKTLPEWYRAANVGYMMDTVHRHPAAAGPAVAVIESLIRDGVDVSVASQVHKPEEHGFGHAYGFVIDRLLGRTAIPVLALMLNTYFPPNVPTPSRCWAIGEALTKALEGLPGDLRICVIASGGLSHFATDADLDRGVLDALLAQDGAMLGNIPPHALRSGNSEILNWIMAGGALGGLDPEAPTYIPVYRTPAGTGIGLGFMIWRPSTSTEPSSGPRHDH